MCSVPQVHRWDFRADQPHDQEALVQQGFQESFRMLSQSFPLEPYQIMKELLLPRNALQGSWQFIEHRTQIQPPHYRK